MLNLNDKKTKTCKILVALATCVLNREYVITHYTYIIENSLMTVNHSLLYEGYEPCMAYEVVHYTSTRKSDSPFSIAPIKARLEGGQFSVKHSVGKC